MQIRGTLVTEDGVLYVVFEPRELQLEDCVQSE